MNNCLLLPCPFCGGPATIFNLLPPSEIYVIQCHGVGCNAVISFKGGERRDEAMKRFYRREAGKEKNEY